MDRSLNVVRIALTSALAFVPSSIVDFSEAEVFIESIATTANPISQSKGKGLKAHSRKLKHTSLRSLGSGQIETTSLLKLIIQVD